MYLFTVHCVHYVCLTMENELQASWQEQMTLSINDSHTTNYQKINQTNNQCTKIQ